MPRDSQRQSEQPAADSAPLLPRSSAKRPFPATCDSSQSCCSHWPSKQRRRGTCSSGKYHDGPSVEHRCPAMLRMRELLTLPATLDSYSNVVPYPAHRRADCVDWVSALELVRSCPHALFAKTPEGANVVHYAARHGKKDYMGFLLNQAYRLGQRGRTIVSRTDENGESPLHRCIFGGDKTLPTAALLIAHGAPLDQVTVEGKTALHCASRRGHTELAKLLLRNGANWDVLCPCIPELDEQWTPLCAAVEHANLEIAMALIRAGASLEADRSYPTLEELRDWDGEDRLDFPGARQILADLTLVGDRRDSN